MEPVDINVSSVCNIRGKDYMVRLECRGGRTMVVAVEDRLSLDYWKSAFDVQYVEDLTHKTGNFKQFNIFASMLESAIAKTSESVSLDLLTYKDLETLRQKKTGTQARPGTSSVHNNLLTSKRYLILTYTVEFDRIHYPLPLPYVGKLDSQALQEEVKSLKTEMRRLKQSQPGEDSKVDKLLRDLRRLEKEKLELEEEFAAFRREVRLTSGSSAVQDMRALRTMVRNLEEQLMKEKTQHQRTSNKRAQEYRDLLEEVEELRASERNLRVRVKSLTSELALYKRGRTLTRRGSKELNGLGERGSHVRNLSSSSRHRSASDDRMSGRSESGSRRPSTSRERTLYGRRSNSLERGSHYSVNGAGHRTRSNSFDRNNSSIRSHLSAGSAGNHSRTPSPRVTTRFNPTAFIREKERKEKEASFKKRRQHKANISGSSSRSKQSGNSSRNSGFSLRESRENSLRSDGNVSDGSDGSYISGGRLKKLTGLEVAPKTASYKMNANERTELGRPPSGKVPKQLASTPDLTYRKTKSRFKGHLQNTDSGDDSEFLDRSAEISEIDERLDRLQKLMKAAMP